MSSPAENLAGGIAMAVRRNMPADWPYAAGKLSAPVLRPILDRLYQVRTAAGSTPDAVETALRDLAGALAANRPLMLAALFSPADLPAMMPRLANRAADDPIDGWMGTCWIAEAAWQALKGPLTDPGYAAGDEKLLLPLAARCRFLALSEPMRHRAQQGSVWLEFEEARTDIPGPARLFGTHSWNRLVGRCREARRAWLDYLDAYQSHPFLAQAYPWELEQELGALTFRPMQIPVAARPRGKLRHAARTLAFCLSGGGEPLGLSVRPLDEPAPLSAEDMTLIGEVTDRHLLPRFDLRRVIALAAWSGSYGEQAGRIALGVLAALAGLAAVGCAAALLVHQATWLSIVCYLLIGAGTLRFGGRWAAPWLLRLPAAAAVGIIALVSFLPGGWVHTPPGGWAAAAVLAAAACGYLAVEARNHGVQRWALLRSLAVAAVGAVHALMISLIGLVAVAPAFVPNGAALSGLWQSAGYGHAGMVLLLATVWCLAVGVFSQILWDDRPITAALAHLSWRSPR